MVFAESILVGRREQQQHKEGKRKAGPPTDPLPKSQGILLLLLAAAAVQLELEDCAGVLDCA